MTSNNIIITLGFTSTGGGSVPVDLSDYVKHIGDWGFIDADNKFPANSSKHNRWYITQASTTLVDQQTPGQPIPEGMFIESKIDNASITDSSHWWIYPGNSI